MIEKNMLKDKWAIPVPAEYSQFLGLEKSGKVYIDLDSNNKRIIIQADNKERKETIEEKDFSEENIIDLVTFILNDNARIKSKIATMLLNKNNNTHFSPREAKCGHCGRILKNNEKLRINGKRICSDCKKIEVQKFLLYLERRKLDAERKERQRN